MRERLNSAKKFSSFIDTEYTGQQQMPGHPPQAPQYGQNPDQQSSPNKSRRALVRSNSSAGVNKQADA